jgi:hypothetical protein
MNPRYALAVKLLGAVLLLLVLAMLFPAVMEFIEAAARDLRYFWWLVLLALLAAWLVWGFGRRKK